MDWPRLLAYITGTVDQELLLRNEYLRTENRILKAQIKGRLLLSDAERATLAEIGHRLGRKALEEVASARAAGPGICSCRAISLLFRKRPQLAGESVIASLRSRTSNAIQA